MMLERLNVHLRFGRVADFARRPADLAHRGSRGTRSAVPSDGAVSTGEVLNLLNDCVKLPTPALLRSTVPALAAAVGN
jgi:hypothetical protein